MGSKSDPKDVREPDQRNNHKKQRANPQQIQLTPNDRSPLPAWHLGALRLMAAKNIAIS